ncbi:phosphoribosylformylglycinamidine synthase, purS [Fischerella sp. NIES-4106]|nr:phosphoribosylformylglycinamidine synthase, purS [Fischerella sp. NIES-4106]
MSVAAFSEKSVQRKYRAKIFVTLRPSVLDPAGVAVQSGLKQMGYNNVEQVRIGKYIEVTLISPDENSARRNLDQICDQMLANPVIENYRFDLIEVESQTGVI